jgi:hypothetical protein
MKTNELDLGIILPASFKDTETWVFNFSGQMICLVNAKNGETFCSEMVSPVNETPDESQLTIYPNPTTDIININLESITADGANVRVFDAFGRELISSTTQDSRLSIPVSTLSPGTYFIEIKSGAKLIRNKFTKL